MGGVHCRRLGCLIAVFFMGHNGAAEQLLASWEEGSTTPSYTPVTVVSASLGLTMAADPYAAGSTDGTYGTFGSGASVMPNSFRIQTAETFTLTVNNTSISNLNLAAIRFDFARRFNGSPEGLSVSYASGDLGAGPVVLFTESTGKFGSDSGDYPDFDVLLSPALADTELAPSESAVFFVSISGGTGSRSMLDNLAVTGEQTTPGTFPSVSVVIDPSDEKWTISPHLIGAHTVYYNDKDAAYSDDSFAAWCKEAGVGTMRFPGGSVVKYWDWENPSGYARGDPWEPNPDPADWGGDTNTIAPEADWMSIDEYLHFCDVSEITPLVGVNYRSGYLYGRMQDSIDRASNCVQYVVDAGYPGAFYYIGNEDMFQVGGVTSSATNFIAHAAAMKAVDPTIKIFWNDNGADPNQMKSWLGAMHTDQTTYPGKAGDYADGYEFHGKWPFGGDPNPAPPAGTYSNWLTEVPLRDYKSGADPNPPSDDPNDWGKTWRDKIADLRVAAVEAGYPDLLMANNEYGWGGGSGGIFGFSKYTMGLLQIDFLQEHFISNYDMACFWANLRGADTGLLDKSDNYKRNPQTLGWELLADAQGATMVESSSSNPYVYGFSAKTDTNLYVYLLNKTETGREVEFSFSGLSPDETQTPEGLSVIDTVDHFGTITSLAVTYNASSNVYTAILPALSYSRVSFTMPPPPTHEELNSVASGNWTNAATWDLAIVPDYLDRALLKFQDVVTVDSPGNACGSLRLAGGQAWLDIVNGGSLEVLDQGAFPTNGTISFKAASSSLGIRLQGGSLTVGGSLEFGAAGSGETNLLLVSGGTLALESAVNVAAVGSGSSMWEINGPDASITVGGDMALGAGAVLQWTADASGIAPIISADTKNVTLNGALTVDLTSMTNHPSEIMLIENDGSGSISGTFSSTNIISSADYMLSPFGGSGNDLSLIRAATPYELWADGYLLTGGPLDNDDNDRLDNLSEYGLGGNPTNPIDPDILPVFRQLMGGGSASFQYIYRRRTAPDSGVSYSVELTDDLVSNVWKTNGAVELSAGDIDGVFESVTNQIPTIGKTNQFIRLRISSE